MSEGFDLGSLLDSATQMQQQMMAAQQAAAEEVVDGVAGGGAVTVRVNGAFEFQSVEIDPAVVDPDDVEMLQDLVLAATRDAIARVVEAQQAAQQQAMGGLDAAGLDLGGLLGGLGQGGRDVIGPTDDDAG